MVEVSELAREKLIEHLRNSESDLAVRVTITAGWGGPSLGLVLDEPKKEDKVFEYEDLKMVIADDLLDELGTVSVDYRDSVWRSGFSISSSKALRGGGGGGCC